MGLFSKDIKTMNDLFLHQLRDIYYAEEQIVENLPTMIDKATDPSLKAGFQTHLSETKNQVQRLKQVFQMLGKDAEGEDCESIDGILKEAKHVAGNVADKEVLDAALLASAQAVEHYEICRYGTLIAWAKELNLTSCIPLLEQNLNEEKATDQKLSALGVQRLNRKATAA